MKIGFKAYCKNKTWLFVITAGDSVVVGRGRTIKEASDAAKKSFSDGMESGSYA